MPFPHDDHYWQGAADFLLKRFGAGAAILAPNEFHEIFPYSYPYDVIPHLDLNRLKALVIHKGALNEVGYEVCSLLAGEGVPLYGNGVFVIFSLQGRSPWRTPDKIHFDEFHRKVTELPSDQPHAVKQHSEFVSAATVILMTTFNRPDRLDTSLRTITALNAPILVVNDGSDRKYAERYAAVYDRYDVRVLELPSNRGLSCALNIGLTYWLPDPKVEWISYLQDDVEVRADLLAALARVQNAETYPLLTGRIHGLQKIYGEIKVNGQQVLLQRMAAGIHLHAHRDYWQKIMPIPTAYFQAPRSWPDYPLRGADEDWWISLWSPNSVVKQGKYVAVLPGLVRTTTVLPAESTWGNPGEPDPLLTAPRYQTDSFVPALLRNSEAKPIRHVEPAVVTNFWQSLAARFGEKAEKDIHRHAPEERAELYHSIDNGSTELEVLNVLNGLVCLFKPNRVMETGTFLGFGSCAIAAALKSNKRGHLFSFEIDHRRLAWAREHIHQFDPTLEDWMTLIHGSSLEYLEHDATEPFDFVFLDSDINIRIEEFRILQTRKLLLPGAVCMIHDTSAYRAAKETGGDVAAFKDRETFASLGSEFQVFEFPYSRGFHLLRYLGARN